MKFYFLEFSSMLDHANGDRKVPQAVAMPMVRGMNITVY